MAMTICPINLHIITPATGKIHVLYEKVNPLETLIYIRYQKLLFQNVKHDKAFPFCDD